MPPRTPDAPASTPSEPQAAPVAPERLRRRCDPAALGLTSTAELTPADGLIGQDRALEALRFGLSMTARGYNLHVAGAPGLGRHNAVRGYVERLAATRPAPDDWVYLHDFDEPFRPRAVSLPAGEGPKLAAALEALIDQLRTGLPAVFESEDFRTRRQAIDDAFAEVQNRAFQTIAAEAERKGLRLIPSPGGMAVAAVKDDKPVPPDKIEAMSPEDRARYEDSAREIMRQLAEHMRAIPARDRIRREEIRALERETAGLAVDRALADRLGAFRAHPNLSDHIDALRAHLIDHAGVFLRDEVEDAPLDRHFNPYRANVLVRSDPAGGAPVVRLDAPDVAKLVGRIEHVAQMGAMLTDFTLVRAGALHRANGGHLLVDAEALLSAPLAWQTLKRCLRAREIAIETAATGAYTLTAMTLEPQPIPLDVKVILFGDRHLLHLLSAHDPDFKELFKVAADFDDEIPRDAEAERLYCRLIAGVGGAEGLRPLDAGACAAVIEQASREAGDAERLTLRIRVLADLLREADWHAAEAGAAAIGAVHVAAAVAGQVRRQDLIREKVREQALRGVVNVATEGAVMGQINGLSVLEIGEFAFGRPARITATARPGTGALMDIERETDLGGPIHTKGVLILGAFLSSRYAQAAPASLAASLVFEQSYGGIDGDSASAAELCALISALARTPLRQDVAVTGALSQTGEVQAIGGVNEKIEGFFDLCAARGLTGTQGVAIPRSNLPHLMLREDVAEACAAGRFTVWTAAHVDEVLALLTGRPAGVRGADGKFPPGSVNALAESRLGVFAAARRAALGGPDHL